MLELLKNKKNFVEILADLVPFIFKNADEKKICARKM
jgi:hypothetical protein